MSIRVFAILSRRPLAVLQFIAACAILCAVTPPRVQAAVTVFTDEAAYLAALTAAGYTRVTESFEDSIPWDAVRSSIAGGTHTAPSVASAGMTWSANNGSSGVTTVSGAARTGSWGFTQLPHGDYSDPLDPITDGFVVTAGSSLAAAGGWFTGQGTSAHIEFILDAMSTTAFNVTLTASPRFLGLIETNGFHSLEVLEREGTFEDQNFIFADDFTFGLSGSATCGDGVIELDEQCDDGNTQSGDCCGASCAYEAGGSPCADDGMPCTDDVCDGAGACAHANSPNGTPCADADACNGAETCNAGACQTGTPLSCDDDNPCTDDACFTISGCAHDESSKSCDDGDACTTIDFCSGGFCVGFALLDCDDGNICTTDICNPVGGCENGDNTSFCDDGDACSVEDRCSAGACVGTALACEEVHTTLAAGGGTVTTDDEGDGATDTDPLETTVDSPVGGLIDITEASPSLDGIGVETLVPSAASASPHRFTFRVDASLGFAHTVLLAADERALHPCADASGTASPDPCLVSRAVLGDGDIEMVALGSQSAVWRVGAAAACKAAPLPDCFEPGALSVLIANKPLPSDRKLKWRWRLGDAFTHTQLGNPLASTEHGLCTYDYTAGTATLVGAQILAAGSGWASRSPSGYVYLDSERSSDGIERARLRADAQGTTFAKIKAIGARVPMPAVNGGGKLMRVDPIVHVQLVNSEGLCWSGELTAGQTLKNVDSRFRARRP